MEEVVRAAVGVKWNFSFATHESFSSVNRKKDSEFGTEDRVFPSPSERKK
jgi:hypothetical protein